MKKATIYHNPNCSKSSKTLAILKENNVEIEEIRYMETPPNKEQLKRLCSLLGLTPNQIVRTGDALFLELGLNKQTTLSQEQWLRVLVEHPSLIERHIVQIGAQVVIARPPEKVLTLI